MRTALKEYTEAKNSVRSFAAFTIVATTRERWKYMREPACVLRVCVCMYACVCMYVCTSNCVYACLNVCVCVHVKGRVAETAGEGEGLRSKGGTYICTQGIVTSHASEEARQRTAHATNARFRLTTHSADHAHTRNATQTHTRTHTHANTHKHTRTHTNTHTHTHAHHAHHASV